jgi:hypothetical protein
MKPSRGSGLNTRRADDNARNQALLGRLEPGPNEKTGRASAQPVHVRGPYRIPRSVQFGLDLINRGIN